jgi:uncharacterized protein (DUF488 family)
VEVTLTTIGFAGKTAEQFFGLLRTAGVKKLIDIRENPGGQLSAFAKHPDISYFLNSICNIVYIYEPRLAPSKEIRDSYRKTKDWSDYEERFLALMRERDVPRSLEPLELTGTVALLCSESGPEKCHRRLVADILAEHLRGQGHSVTVSHLVIPKPEKPPGKRRRKNVDDGTPDQRNHLNARGVLRNRREKGD